MRHGSTSPVASVCPGSTYSVHVKLGNMMQYILVTPSGYTLSSPFDAAWWASIFYLCYLFFVRTSSALILMRRKHQIWWQSFFISFRGSKSEVSNNNSIFPLTLHTNLSLPAQTGRLHHRHSWLGPCQSLTTWLSHATHRVRYLKHGLRMVQDVKINNLIRLPAFILSNNRTKIVLKLRLADRSTMLQISSWYLKVHYFPSTSAPPNSHSTAFTWLPSRYPCLHHQTVVWTLA